jgi:hypothetical protein
MARELVGHEALLDALAVEKLAVQPIAALHLDTAAKKVPLHQTHRVAGGQAEQLLLEALRDGVALLLFVGGLLRLEHEPLGEGDVESIGEDAQ